MILSFQASDRILILAPHPDDESLATGGLIQRAKAIGARVRVVYATDGDNNPWPQRWAEKQWNIGSRERRCWGALRRREARKALQKLGLAEKPRFLHIPDQEVNKALMKADDAVLGRLCREIENWRPTCLVLPSPYDQHPDHNAFYVLLQIALQRCGQSQLRQIHYLVHCRHPEHVPGLRKLVLSTPERLGKYEAIRCHATQMVLSCKRFLSYARPAENFYQPEPAQPLLRHHPLGEAWIYAGALNLTLVLPPKWQPRGSILAAGESAKCGGFRYKLDLPLKSGKIRLHDTVSGMPGRYASVRISGQLIQIRIPLASRLPLRQLFVKLDRRTIFLDAAGWREVPVPYTISLK